MSTATVAFYIFLIALLTFVIFIAGTVLLVHGVWLKWIDRQRFPLVAEIAADLFVGACSLLIGFAIMEVVL